MSRKNVISLSLSILALLLSDNVKAETIEALTIKAQQDDIDAQFELSQIYAFGIETEENPEEAMRWLQEAAENQHIQAQYQLATNHKQGKNAPIDLKLAYYWYLSASLQGDSLSKIKLGDLFASPQATSLTTTDLAEIWYQVASKTNPEAEAAYAKILEDQYNQKRGNLIFSIQNYTPSIQELDTLSLLIQLQKSIPYYYSFSALTLVFSILYFKYKRSHKRRKGNRKTMIKKESVAGKEKKDIVILQKKLRDSEENNVKTQKQLKQFFVQYKKLQHINNNQEQKKDIALAYALFGYSLDKPPQEKEIKSRYRQLSKLYHPDTRGSTDDMIRLNESLKLISAHMKAITSNN